MRMTLSKEEYMQAAPKCCCQNCHSYAWCRLLQFWLVLWLVMVCSCISKHKTHLEPFCGILLSEIWFDKGVVGQVVMGGAAVFGMLWPLWCALRPLFRGLHGSLISWIMWLWSWPGVCCLCLGWRAYCPLSLYRPPALGGSFLCVHLLVPIALAFSAPVVLISD